MCRLHIFFKLLIVVIYCTPSSAEVPPKIGVILPLTGGLAAVGQKVRNGIILAAEAEGVPLANFAFEDGEFSNVKALTAFQKLSSTDGIDALIGPFGPGQTDSLIRAANAKKIPVVAVALCDKKFKEFENALCTYLSPREQAAPIIERFRGSDISVQATRVGIVIEDVEGFQEYRQMAEEFGREPGRTLVASETFSGDTTDFRSTLLKLKTQSVSLFVFAAVDPHKTAIALRQAKQIGFKPAVPWIFTELDQSVFEQNRDIFDGLWFLSMGVISERFKSRYKDRYHEEPDLYPAIGFDATRSLIRALASAEAREPEIVTRRLYEQRLLDTAFRGFHFDRDRGVSMEARLTRVEDGKVVFVSE